MPDEHAPPGPGGGQFIASDGPAAPPPPLASNPEFSPHQPKAHAPKAVHAPHAPHAPKAHAPKAPHAPKAHAPKTTATPTFADLQQWEKDAQAGKHLTARQKAALHAAHEAHLAHEAHIAAAVKKAWDGTADDGEFTPDVPGYCGSIGPSCAEEYCQPHVYARDVNSGAGNCVCGAAPGDLLHTEIAPGVPVPDDLRAVAKSGAEPEQRLIVGLAYQCGMDPRIGKGMDGGRDFFTKDELLKAAHSFMKNGPVGGLFHADGTEGHVTFVESGIHRGPAWDAGNGLVLKDGDWFLAAICDDVAWNLVKSGKVTGFSPQGTARRRRPQAVA